MNFLDWVPIDGCKFWLQFRKYSMWSRLTKEGKSWQIDDEEEEEHDDYDDGYDFPILSISLRLVHNLYHILKA